MTRLEEETPRVSEKLYLNPGEIVLFPQPSFLHGYGEEAIMRPLFLHHIRTIDINDVPKTLREQRIYYDDLKQQHISDIILKKLELVQEYNAVLWSLRDLLGRGNIRLMRYPVVQEVYDPETMQRTIRERPSTELQGFETVDIVDAKKQQGLFIRDVFAQIGEFVFVNPSVRPDFKETERYILSPLGEMGKVWVAGRVVFVSEDLESNALVQKHLKLLRGKGFRVGYLPVVKNSKQPEGKREFAQGHIDGHTFPVVGSDKKVHIFYLASYADQGEKTGARVRKMCEAVGAEPIKIPDDTLPFLPLNGEQYRDGTVHMCATGQEVDGIYRQSVLEIEIKRRVGEDKLQLIRPPLNEIVLLGAGGFRCLTNRVSLQFLTAFQRN